jgi:hypothetical protein
VAGWAHLETGCTHVATDFEIDFEMINPGHARAWLGEIKMAL